MPLDSLTPQERHERLKEEAKNRKDYNPLFKKYLAETVDTTGMTLKQRIQNRHDRYEAYLKEFSALNETDVIAEAWNLELAYYGCEWRELELFKTPIEYTEQDMVDGAVQPAKDKVLILTANDGKGNTQIGGALKAARENRKEYCNYHGCIEYFVDLSKYIQPGSLAVWAKIDSIREAFDKNPGVEWVWWLDTDAIIMNAELDVAKHVLSRRALKERLTYGRPLHSVAGPFHQFIYMEKGEVDVDQIDLVITQDFNGFNAGSFFIRRSQFTEFLLEYWPDKLLRDKGFLPYAEQSALSYIILAHERYHQHVGLVPQRMINSYTDDPNGVWSFKPGDFVVHLAGCKERNLCEPHFNRFWKERIQVPEKYRLAERIDLESLRVNKEG